MKILLTGFEPFGGCERNISWDAVSALDYEGVRKELLPVSFKRAAREIERLLDEYEPQVLLMFGFASKRDKVNIERVAINVMDSTNPDNDGYQPVDEPVSRGGKTAFFATIPIKDIVKHLNESEIPASVTNSAGTYVCNTVMYSALQHIEKLGKHCIAGFIHLPDIPLKEATEAIIVTIDTINKFQQ